VTLQTNNKLYLLFILTLLLALILRGSTLLGRAWGNAGMLVLAQALVAAPDVPVSRALSQAEEWFQRAVAYAPEDRFAWRGLGFALVLQGREGEAVTAWQRTGNMAWECLQRGEKAREAKRYEEALTWYERAAWVEPGWGDPWYYAGLTYEALEQWEEARGAYERAIETGAFTGVGWSSPYYRLGVIYQWRLEPRQTDAALTAYETALEVNRFSTVREAADCHYKRGEVLWWTGGDPGEYIAEYRQAIELNPQHAFAHIMLGVAYYIRYKDVAMAEAEIRQGLELSPENEWAYLHLGDIYRQAGRTDEAAAMYERALEIAPKSEAARERLQALHEGD